MPVDTTLKEIIRSLAALTQQGKLPWSTTPDENSFRAILGPILVRVSVVPDEENMGLRPRYSITIVNNEGNVVEDCRLSGEEAQSLEQLHTLARRTALNTDGVLSAFLSDLKRRLGAGVKVP